MGMMDQDILKVLYTEKQIAARIEAMGMEMYDALKDKREVLTSTLSNERGQFFFRKRGYTDCGALLLPGEPLEIILRKELTGQTALS